MKRIKPFLLASVLLFTFIFAISIYIRRIRHDDDIEHGFGAIISVSDDFAIVINGRRRTIFDMRNRRLLLPFGNYDDLQFDRYGDFLLVQRDGKQGIIHIESGEIRLPFCAYSIMRPQTDDIVIVTLNGEFGAFSLDSGEMLIPFGQFDRINAIESGMALVGERELITAWLDPSRYDNRCFRIECFDSNHTLYDCFYHCDYWADCHYQTVFHLQVVDISSGEVIIPLRYYEQIQLFPNGIIHVMQNGRFALIDVVSGDKIIPFGRYDELIEIYNNKALVLFNNEVALISLENMEQIIPFGLYTQIHLGFMDGIASIVCGRFMGLVCIQTGTEIITPDHYNLILERGSGFILATSFQDSYHIIYDLTSREIVNSLLITGDLRSREGCAYSRVIYLSNTSAATHIIWDYGNSERRAEFEILNVATNEIIITSDICSNVSQLFRPSLGPDSIIYAEGLFVVRQELEGGRVARGLIKTENGEVIIPICENSPYIHPLSSEFVALRYTGGRWRIECVESLMENLQS